MLGLEGNIAAGLDFVAAMLQRSHYVSLGSRDEALAWLAGIRPGGPGYTAWLKTVVHHYNGCAPGCGVYEQRYAHYDFHARKVWDETGADFWSGPGVAPTRARRRGASRPWSSWRRSCSRARRT